MGRRKPLVLIAFVIVSAMALWAVWPKASVPDNKPLPTPAEQEEVSVRFPIPIVESGQATFYAAMDNGRYAGEGLKVTFEMGSPELNPVKMVASGTDNVGVLGGPDTLLVARSRGQKLKAIAVIHRNSNFSCLITLKSSGISDVNQLNGKKVGFYYGHISTDVIRNLFRLTNTHVTEVDSGFNYSQLIAGQIAASWGFTVTAGLDLPAQGIPINIISPRDYGIITQGYTIFVRDEMIEKRPDLVLRFLRASLKGVSDVVTNPNVGVDAILKRTQATARDLLVRRQAAYNAVTSDSAKYPPGYMDRQMFQETYDRLLQEGVIAQPFDVGDAYTTKFLEQIYGRQF